MRLAVEVSGDEEMLSDLERMGQKGVEIGLRVLEEGTKEILTKSRPLVPVDDEDGGDLRDSGRVTKPTRTSAGRLSAGVVYGGDPLKRTLGKRKANVYAVVQHEDLTLRHTTGGAKFLERPGNDVAPKIPERLQEAIDRENFGAR